MGRIRVYSPVERIKKVLEYPLTRCMELDDPKTTALRKSIIKEKPFLNRIYKQWYKTIADPLESIHGPILEIGSGGGFLSDFIPDLISSDIFFIDSVSLVTDAARLPFQAGSLSAIVMTDVLHHLPDVRSFFYGATECLKKNGLIIMIEPWITPWSNIIYRYLLHEPFEPDTDRWEFPTSGPLSGANTALPWMLFSRDRETFEKEFFKLQIGRIEPIMPFLYMVSGGISMKSLMPEASFSFWRSFENMLSPWMKYIAMFAQITLKKTQK